MFHETMNRWKSVQVGQGNRSLRKSLQFPVSFHHQERMPAKIKEIIVGPDPVKTKNFLPDRYDLCFKFVLGRNIDRL